MLPYETVSPARCDVNLATTLTTIVKIHTFINTTKMRNVERLCSVH